ncbi:MAG: DUF6049 family protein [Nocardioidaceae bacterium]
MVRRAQLLLVLAATTPLLIAAPAVAGPGEAVPAAAAGVTARSLHAASARADDLPLQVTITSLTPSVVPAKGPLRIAGTVSNVSDETYDDIRVYGLTSTVPMTTRQELADAAESDPAIEVGDRITDKFDSIDSLEPGGVTPYSLTIPHRLLPVGADSPAGVYWLGVHALGATAAGRDLVADGKARSFLPHVPEDDTRVDTALVMSIRHGISFRQDGRLAEVPRWRAALAPGGSLQSLVGFARAAGTRPLTWLIDPAVTEAIGRLAEGNPARQLGRTPSRGGEPTAEPVDPGEADGEAALGRSRPSLTAASQGADLWLAGARTALVGDQLLALPYGDMDVSAAARWSPGLYRTARQRGSGNIPRLGLAAGPVVAPPDGYLAPEALAALPPKTTVLTTDRMLPDEVTAEEAPALVRTERHSVVVTDTASTTGGPGPGPQTSPLQTRQRILSEAALRLLDGGQPLVVRLPDDWSSGTPVDAEEFFLGLDVPWLHLTTVASVTQGKRTRLDPDDLRYPDDEAAAELDAANFAAARSLADAGSLLQSVLPANRTVAGEVRDEALTTVSYASREEPNGSRVAAERSRGVLTHELGKVTVDPPSSVTLSSESGPFTATVTNGLDQRVKVKLVARTDGRLDVTASPVVELGPGELASVEMTARSSVLGLHDVDLFVANADGRPIGGTATFPLRAAQVSNVIWVVFAVGGVLLFGAIAVRTFRRVRGWLAGRGAAA